MSIKTIYGNHSPFDSDSCFEWGMFCLNHNHNPDIKVSFLEENKRSVLLQNIDKCEGLTKMEEKKINLAT